MNIVTVVGGLIFIIWGILVFSGKTRLGRKNFSIGKFVVTNELLGIIFFFIGICLLLVFLTPIMEPKLLIN